MLSQPSVLVIDDFSEPSSHALIFAEKLRKITNGSLLVAFPIFSFLEEQVSLINIEDNIQKHLEELGVIAQSEILEGDFLSSLKKLIHRETIDFLILGETLTHPFIGSSFVQASNIVDKIDIPLLIIRKPDPIERVDVLIDPRYSMDKLINLGEEFSALLSSQLGIVSIWQESTLSEHLSTRMGYPYLSTDISEEQRSLFLRKLQSIIRHRVSQYITTDVQVDLPRSKDVSNQLLEIINHDHANLIIIQKHQKRSLQTLLKKSPLHKIINNFEGNILICPS